MNRDILINFIPKPKNEEVILYDTSLKDLIDVDVMKEYKELLPTFNFSCQQFLGYKGNIENYEKQIDGIFLLRTSWTEEDYLYNLQNYKKTYANMYGPIKKMESNIELLQRKIEGLNENIQYQKAKDEKDMVQKRKNIDKQINENVDRVTFLKECLATFKIEQEKINKNIQENQEEFLVLEAMFEAMENGEGKCQYCGHKLSNVSKNSNIYKKTMKNLLKNKKEMEKLLELKDKNDTQIKEYEKQIAEIKEALKNDSNFKSQTYNFYQKKSEAVLRLEGQRDSMLKQIEEIKKKLSTSADANSDRFLELKSNIKKCELSLENLQKVKEIKEKIEKERIEYNRLYKEIAEMRQKIDKYIKFLTIFFRIYEQKAADFCGKEFKFKIFEFDKYTLIEKFEIYYNSVLYENLEQKKKRLVEDFLIEKFLVFED